jgi:hypothetical protein
MAALLWFVTQLILSGLAFISETPELRRFHWSYLLPLVLVPVILQAFKGRIWAQLLLLIALLWLTLPGAMAGDLFFVTLLALPAPFMILGVSATLGFPRDQNPSLPPSRTQKDSAPTGA